MRPAAEIVSEMLPAIGCPIGKLCPHRHARCWDRIMLNNVGDTQTDSQKASSEGSQRERFAGSVSRNR